jgi:hypothetical protein
MPREQPPITHLESRVEQLWIEYVVLRERAEKSRDIKVGIAAGKAWARFLLEFVPPANRDNGGGQ